MSRYIIKILTIIFIIYSIILTNFYPFKSKYSSDTTEVIGIVTKYKIDGDKVTINLKAKEKLIINYYLKDEHKKSYYIKKLKLGDKIKIEGIFYKATNNTIPNLFNYQTYLYQNKIYYQVSADNITKIKNNTSIFYHLKNKIIKRIESFDKTGYLKTFILGDKSDLNINSLNNYQKNGISHLFSISGMHVSLLIEVIMFVLDKVSYNNKYKYTILDIVLLFYLFLTDVTASILRTTIMTILISIDKCFNLKIKKIDIMLLTLIIAIIVNPFIILQTGFQFSYTISLTLVLLNKKINKIKNKLKRNLYISFVCFLVSFPICIYYYYQANFLSILFNLVVIPIVSIIIFPLSLLTFIFPFLYDIFEYTIIILEYINSCFTNIDFGIIIFSKPSLFLIFIYYILIFSSLYNKKVYIVLLVVMIIHKNYSYLDTSFNLIALDVGQGDSLFLKLPNNKGNILIDTGGIVTYEKETWQKRKTEYSLSNDSIIPYLKSVGINKLDYLIITHGDYDHMGEAINLVNNIKIEKVIFNCGVFNELELDLIKVLDNKKISYYSCIKELNINENKLYFLNNKIYDNENDNSSVIYTKLNNYKFLFMGDAGINVEEDLIEKYNIQNIDVLKVGHHGSKTSSSKKFINEINPKYSIISVGKNNRYRHPNNEVLNNLEDSKIYRTDQNGSIMLKIKNNKLNVETCAP